MNDTGAAPPRHLQKRSSPLLKWAAALLVLLFLYWGTWWSGPASGRIVDGVTGKPLGDVVVVSTWTLHRSISGGWLGYVELQETRTDSDGVFHLSAWGPRFRLNGNMYPQEPWLRAVRPGYLPLEVGGFGTAVGDARALRMTAASAEEYRRSLQLFVEGLPSRFAMAPFECAWRKTPQLNAALQSEARVLGGGAQASVERVADEERADCRCLPGPRPDWCATDYARS